MYPLKAQLLYSYNAEDTIVKPIDWESILHAERTPQTPRAIRSYLSNVVERMNKYFAVCVHGPMTGKIMVTREARAPGGSPESIFVSVWRAQSLFPRKIQLRWREGDLTQTLFKPAVDVWLRSSARREILPTSTHTPPPHPLVKWLKAMLSMPDEVSLLQYDALNPRRTLLDSFWQHVRTPAQWTAKRFWQTLYSICPQSRPAKYSRVKLRGVDHVFVPSREQIADNIAFFERHSTYGQMHF